MTAAAAAAAASAAAAGCVVAAGCFRCRRLRLPAAALLSNAAAAASGSLLCLLPAVPAPCCACSLLCPLPAVPASKLDVFVCLILPRSWLLSHTHVIIGWVFNITFSLALVYASTWLVRRARVRCQGCVGLACAAAAGMRNSCWHAQQRLACAAAAARSRQA